MASERALNKLNKRHAGFLQAEEQIHAVLDAVSPSQAQPSPGWMAFGLVGALIGHAMDNAKVPARVAALEAQFGRLTRMPESKNGYKLAMTDRRLIIFDSSGKNVLAEVPRSNLHLRSCEHANGLHSIVLDDGAASYGVTASRSTGRGDVNEFLALAQHGGPAQLAA